MAVDGSSASPRTRAARVFKRSYHDLRHAVIESGLAPAQTDYTRFVLLASARTGSNMLARALNNHSAIIVYGEILRHPERFPFHFPQFGNSQALFEADPQQFLDSRVFGRYPPDVGAVGFKLFYRHAPRDTAWGQDVWDYLTGDNTIRVIHLRRSNLLEVEVSRQKAAVTDEWIKYSDGQQATAVTLDYEPMVARFQQMERWQEEAQTLFTGHPLLDVSYEDLVGDYVNQMAAVQQFLGVPFEPVEPSTRKRIKRPLGEQIANYDELESRLDGTPWAEFLMDQ